VRVGDLRAVVEVGDGRRRRVIRRTIPVLGARGIRRRTAAARLPVPQSGRSGRHLQPGLGVRTVPLAGVPGPGRRRRSSAGRPVPGARQPSTSASDQVRPRNGRSAERRWWTTGDADGPRRRHQEGFDVCRRVLVGTETAPGDETGGDRYQNPDRDYHDNDRHDRIGRSCRGTWK